jgi:general secretion pathway protein I
MRRYRQTGMSLLEVLVAFAILALVLGVIMQIFSSGMRASRLGESYSKAVLLAESKLAEFTPVVGDPINEQGEFGKQYRWRIQIEPFDDGGVFENANAVGLSLLRVEVEWSDGDKQKRVALSTLRPKRS